jgi:hypothetical protein
MKKLIQASKVWDKFFIAANFWWQSFKDIIPTVHKLLL